VDGVLLLCMENDEYLRAFAGWGTPGVVVDYRPDAAPLDCLVCDNAGGVRRAMEYLAGLGHRRIAYVDSPQQGLVRYRYDLNHPLLSRLSSDRVERRTAFQEALATLGLGSGNDGGWLPESTGDSWGNMRLVAEQWRAAAVRPSAFLVYDDIHALDLLGQLAAVGARAPQDVSVCAVAGAAGAAFEGRPLAYSCFNFIDMGRQAVRILQTRCQCPDGQPLAVHRIGFQFIEGATAGKAGE
jgi:LacI family transcriptional regulator